VGSLWALLLLIGPLIFVHELGHLVAAKLVGVKATRFSIGFGPALFKFRIGETEYRVGPIPLGGYVSLLGHSPHEQIPESEADRALSAKPLWARIFVLAAGPIANFILPLALYFVYFLGHTALAPAVVGTVIDDSAAAAAGLQQGDRVVAMDGRDVRSWVDMSQRVAASPGEEVRMQIERDGARFDRFVTPRKIVRRNRLGVVEAMGRLGVTRVFYAPQVGIIDRESTSYQEGLRTGDVITSVNGEPVETTEALTRMLEMSGDSQIRLTYLRARPVSGRFATFLWYESRHAQLLPRKENYFKTGLLPANTFIRSVEAGSPAEVAGIKVGDRLLSVEGQDFTKWEYLTERLVQRQEEPLDLRVQSPGGAIRTVTVRQKVVGWRDIYKQDRKRLWFGARPHAKMALSEAEPIRGRFTYAVGSAVDETLNVMGMTWTVLRQMLTFQRGMEDIGSVIGLLDVAGTAAEQGPTQFMFLMALLSINLGFVNLLPIPILDGGHILFFSIEAIRRRPLEQRAREITSAIGLMIILLLLLVAARNDIMRYWMD
jgi:regulator of sigma E protease